MVKSLEEWPSFPYLENFLMKIAGARVTSSVRRLTVVLPMAACIAAFGPDAGQASLQPLGPARTLNTSPPGGQDEPAVTGLEGGVFVVVWRGEVDGGKGIAARLLDLGTEPAGAELTLRLLPEGVTAGRPRVAPADDGGFLVAWSENAGADGETVLLLQGFADDATPRGPAVPAALFPTSEVVHYDLASHPDGISALTWSSESSVWMRLFEADLGPRSEVVEVLAASLDSVHHVGRVAVTLHPHPLGDALVVWEQSSPDPMALHGGPAAFDRLQGRIHLRSDGTPLDEPFLIHQLPAPVGHSLAPAVAPLASSFYVATWIGLRAEHIPAVHARVVGIGRTWGELIEVDAPVPVVNPVFEPEVAAWDDGSVVFSWSETPTPPAVDPLPPGVDHRIGWLRHFHEAGFSLAPQGDPIRLSARAPGRWQTKPAVAVTPGAGGARRLLAVWRDHLEPELASPGSEEAAILARGFGEPCVESEERLCLQGGRFAVEVVLDDPRLDPPIPRAGGAQPLTQDTGTFWFFHPANVELVAKVLDGRRVNGNFWFFSGALSNVGHEVVVTDTLTGAERRYRNLPGELTSRADTRAFADPLPASTSPAIGNRGQEAPPQAWVAVPVQLDGSRGADHGAGSAHAPPPCSGSTVLCLHEGRIRVRLDWHNPRQGTGGQAFGEALSEESGWFWFFSPDNAELAVKVLDGSAVNGRYWVFFGGLTDLELTLHVEDVLEHTAWSYHKPPFALTSHADTAALPKPSP